MDRLQIEYALARQIPEMPRGFEIHTNYGQFALDGKDAEKVAALVEKLLRSRLAKLPAG